MDARVAARRCTTTTSRNQVWMDRATRMENALESRSRLLADDDADEHSYVDSFDYNIYGDALQSATDEIVKQALADAEAQC